MKKEDIFTILQKEILECLPELSKEVITLDNSLVKLGANSLDRSEIIVQVMMRLGIKIPMVEFMEAKNISDIVEVFQKKLSSKT